MDDRSRSVVPVSQAVRNDPLAFNDTSIQQWIEAKRLGVIKKPTQEFEWTSDTVIGRYFHPDGMPPMRDASVVRVVLKYLPDGHPPYSIVTTYPREALSG